MAVGNTNISFDEKQFNLKLESSMYLEITNLVQVIQKN